jgi:uncharacterized protein (TIGR02147 family)
LSIFDHSDYKKYFNAWVAALPKGGRGEYRRVSEALGVSTTMISQVFNGDKHLSLELASDLADYLMLSEVETNYLFLLVESARAGSFKLSEKLKKRINDARTEARKLEARVKAEKELSEETKSIFYSSWIYAAVRSLTALSDVNNVQTIADRLHLPRPQVQKVIEFLMLEGLVTEKAHKLEPGVRSTYLKASSPLVPKHHQNWRIAGFQKMVLSDTDNFFYTGPYSLSREVADKIRQELPSFVERIRKDVLPSESETVRCLNIDWFEF